MSNHPVHPPIRTNDPNTIIALHGFISGVPAFRIPASNIPTFTALCVATYSAFQNEVEEYRLHFHFRQDVPCDERELLEREKWDAGAYFIGGSIDIYAHFMRRDNLGGAGEMGVMIQRGVGVGRRSPPLSSLARFPLTSYSVGRGYSSRAGASTRRMNLDSTTVYSLGMVMPNKWYPGVKYFSAPYVFIPDLGARARMQLFPPKDASKWPGFRGVAGYDSSAPQNWQDDDKVLVGAEEEPPRGVEVNSQLQDTGSGTGGWNAQTYIQSLLGGGEVLPGSDAQDGEVRADARDSMGTALGGSADPRGVELLAGNTRAAVQSGGASEVRSRSAMMISSESEEVEEEESEEDDKMSSPEYGV